MQNISNEIFFIYCRLSIGLNLKILHESDITFISKVMIQEPNKKIA